MSMRLDGDTQLNNELERICSMDLPESEIVEEKLNMAYQQIYSQAKKESKAGGKKRMKTRKTLYMKILAIAAGLLIVVFGGIGVANPALAAKIPVIGKIFSYLEDKVSYPGDYSENAVVVETQDQGNAENEKETVGDAAGKDNGYVQNKNGITVAVTELSRDSDKLYMALRITNEEGFPEDFQTKFPETGLSSLSCNTSAVVHQEGQDDVQYSEAYGNIPLYYIEGEFQDSNTFVGIAMLEFDDLSECTKLDFTFHNFYGLLSSTHEMEGHVAGEEETVTILEHDQKNYEGPWNFTFDLEKVDKAKEVIVNQKNDDGFGIDKVVKSTYEISAVPILPEGVQEADYIVSIWDADGKPLESHGNNVEQYATYGHNTEQVTIYLLEFETWLKCKGENVSKQAENAVFAVDVSLQ